MAVTKTICVAATAAAFVFCSFLVSISAIIVNEGKHFHVGYYSESCPQAEQIVSDVVYYALRDNRALAAGIIRLFFHDCFVKGCDASILLDSTPSGEPIEKTSPANGKSLRGLELIDQIKAELENACPGIVSCADILSFAARDATVFSGIPFFSVPSGRRDGMSSRAADVFGSLPPPTMNVNSMAEIFAKKGMTIEELVVLTGAHSIGQAHCSSFDYRLYNYSSYTGVDPELDRSFALYMSLHCPRSGRFARFNDGVHFDPLSPYRLDNSFYRMLVQQKSLLQSDQALANDPKTRDIVQRMAFEPMTWSNSFVDAMVRLGKVDVLKGKHGEIRKHCRSVN